MHGAGIGAPDNEFKSPSMYLPGNNESNSKKNAFNYGKDLVPISPVCSRLRDHISMLNDENERLFLSSPGNNHQIPWPSVSPYDFNKNMYHSSTAPNTSSSSKYMNPIES
jgi:hypothetical protein